MDMTKLNEMTTPRRKSTAEAATDYAAKDPYIAQRANLLKNAFNAGAAWLYANQWRDVYEEMPARSGRYLAIYLVDRGDGYRESERYAQQCVMLTCRVEDGQSEWVVEDGSPLPFAITHWAHIPKMPPISLRPECAPLPTAARRGESPMLTFGILTRGDGDEMMRGVAKSVDAYFRKVNAMLAKADPDDERDVWLDGLAESARTGDLYVNDLGNPDRMWHLQVDNGDTLAAALRSGASCEVKLSLVGSVKG